MTGRIRCASIFQKTKCRAATAGRRATKAATPFVDRAEWMDQAPISKFVKEVLEQRTK